MTWFGWFMVAWMSYSALLVISQVGKPKTPTTPKVAVGSVVLVALLVVGTLTIGTGSL